MEVQALWSVFCLEIRGKTHGTEDRFGRIGKINGATFIAFFTLRGTSIRIISARRASSKESAYYEQNKD